MKIKIFENTSVATKVADAELIFEDGPLAGLKLVGFTIWRHRSRGFTVTFPSRSYTVNGERRSFALLRPFVDATAQNGIRDAILDAYHAHVDGETVSRS